ncbi:aldo/keto reductase [Lactiplantibacillus herbarum]|uniref:aldo/keto reductase n=1 Tax=Lactiplantibacillus herbarum TaxID=1670446 RepID=UPI00064EBE2D|nr:aldo/keto reductase [Lactiplantibacillus herbarum]
MTTLKTPAIINGTWAWGGDTTGGGQVFGNHLTMVDLKPVVDQAMANGLNFWDTAAIYGHGASETNLGELLQPYSRDSYQLSTKFTPQLAQGDAPMADMLAGSLNRLHTDYVDLYWIHNPADVEKWTPELIPLVKSGQIKHVGVSNHNLAQLKRTNEILNAAGITIDAVQNHFSLLYRSSEEAGIIDYCQSHNIDFWSYMVLEQGALTGRYNVDNPLPTGSIRATTYNHALGELEQVTDKLNSIGARTGASTAQVAMAYAMVKGTTPIVGITKPKYIKDALHAAQVDLTATDLVELEDLAAQTKVDVKSSWENSMA